MTHNLKALILDAATGFYTIKRYPLGEFFGPVDLGLHLAGKHNAISMGVGIFAGSIIPGSNRLVVTGFSPAWGGFYVSSMGGAGLVFDDLGINLLSIIGKSAQPSVLILNRQHGEEIEVSLEPLPVTKIWDEGEKGVYAMLEHVHTHYSHLYEYAPRILAVGPAARYADCGGIVSAPIRNGKLTDVDTWAGRGGMGSKLYQQHGICAVIYGGTHIDEDFRDSKVADEWFQARYEQKMMAKDLEATKKYRFDPDFDTGGTFGVNYAKNASTLLAFNYRSIYWDEQQRREFHKQHIEDHYLKQFNSETIATKQFSNCGEPCVAVCKKNNGKYKKDYEPYQTLGPLIGIFDQRAAEKVNRKADSLGFDAISIGGFISWAFDCLDSGLIEPADLGISGMPRWDIAEFDAVQDSLHNAMLAIEILDNCVGKERKIDLADGARKYVRRMSRQKQARLKDKFLINSFARNGWMVPNQYWVPGVPSPMPAMGRYYMHYAQQYFPPRLLGKINVDRMKAELELDNLGICRFHRAWAEEMIPLIIEKLHGKAQDLELNTHVTARRINCRNASVMWESSLATDYIVSYLKRCKNESDRALPELDDWLKRFEDDPREASLSYWYEIRKGIDESLFSEFEYQKQPDGH